MTRKYKPRPPSTYRRGAEVPTSKLTEAKVVKIRKQWATDSFSLRDLAHVSGVSHETIRKIVARQTWAHVP